jgi:hypothetical protein
VPSPFIVLPALALAALWFLIAGRHSRRADDTAQQVTRAIAEGDGAAMPFLTKATTNEGRN